MIVELDEEAPSPPTARGRIGHAPVLAAIAAAGIVAVALAVSAFAPGRDSRALSVPAGLGDVRLSVLPDRLLNDPPDARFRLPVSVRGAVGLGSVEGPPAVTWSEGGFWYELSSPVHTVAELAELAGALR
ncbi:MAG TPA: hypothetical protein VMJ92_04970 [Candidatus Limnocylindrales bacterium]|nr:hypothetical protein [Candidatus Limnocylindrales bacterium]